MDTRKIPGITDALEAIAIIYEIQERYEDAVKTYDRLLQLLEEAWGYTEGEPIREVLEKKQHLMEKY